MTLPNTGLLKTIHGAGSQEAGHLRARTAISVRRQCAPLALNAGYPLCAVALWIGAAYGMWTASAIVIVIGIVLSFAGFFLRQGTLTGEPDAAARAGAAEKAASRRSFEFLYRRYGGVTIILAACLAFAVKTGWTFPMSYLIWLGLICVSVFIASAFG